MKRNIYIAAGCMTVLLGLFFSVDPNRVPSFMLVLPFILLFVAIFALVAFAMQKWGVTGARNFKVAALCASLPVLLLVLQSIGQLTPRDILTVAVLFILSFFYISRTTLSS